MSSSSKKILCASLVFFWITIPICADDVLLRSGEKYINVKTKLRQRTLYILTSRGIQISIPLSEVRSFNTKPVNWKDGNATRAVPLPPPKKTPSLPPRPRLTASQILSPAQSLIPVWSGLYRTDYWYIAPIFSVLEGVFFYEAVKYSESGKKYFSNSKNMETLLYLRSPLSGLPQNSFASFYYFIHNQSLVQTPGGGFTTPDKFRNTKERYESALLWTLLFDFLADELFRNILPRTLRPRSKPTISLQLNPSYGRAGTNWNASINLSVSF